MTTALVMENLGMKIRPCMPSVRSCSWIVALVPVATVLLQIGATAIEPVQPEAGAEERRAALVRTMQSLAAGLKVVRVTDGEQTQCTMVEASVLNWSDSARHPDLIVPGTTWIWHDNGCPMFVGEIYGRVDSVGTWTLLVCNLSPEQLRCSDDRIQMTLTSSYYAPKEIVGSPVVAETESDRTSQMKRLAERFDAHQFWEERFELRLLPKPIYRYKDAEAGIIDGGVFALVHGTNPEVLLLIEAHSNDVGAPSWKVGFGSLAGARCVVRLDEKEYWTCPKYTGDIDDPRQIFIRDIPVVERKGKPGASEDK